MVENWFWWGLGWLLMPRMTIGLILIFFTPYYELGLALVIIGGILDL